MAAVDGGALDDAVDIGDGAPDPVKIDGEAGGGEAGGCVAVVAVGGVWVYVRDVHGGGSAAAAVGTAAAGEGAAVTEEPPRWPVPAPARRCGG